MKYSHILQQEIDGLVMKLSELSHINDELWSYHPSNENFINPIKAFNENLSKIADIERMISELEYEINEKS